MEDYKSYKIAFGKESLKLKLDKISLSCFILENGQRIFSRSSIQKALGYDGKSENWLFEFLVHINRLTIVDPVLLESLGKKIIFERQNQGELQLDYAIGPKLFIEACKAIVKANNEGFLYLSELKFAKNAEIILKNTDGTDIEKWIDFATGFDLFKQNHKEILVRFMTARQKPYAIWIKSFPDAFFESLFSSMEWTWEDLNKNPEKVGNYLDELIFSRIDSGLLNELRTGRPKMKYRKKNMPEQHLEHPELQAHMHAMTTLMNASGMKPSVFEQLINKGFPRKNDLPVMATINKSGGETETPKLAQLNENLRKALFEKK